MKTSIALVGAALIACTASTASAQTKLINSFNDWLLFAHKGTPADICFISSQPKELKPPAPRGNRSFFYVSNWPKDGVKSEISVKIGRSLKTTNPVVVQIGNEKYTLFIKGDKAFVSDPTQETQLINSMKRGSFMVVRATMANGKSATETYSLIGITKALTNLSQACK